MKVGYSAAGTPLIEQLAVKRAATGEGACATSQHDWPEEQVAFVHQARPKRLGGEIGSAHGEIVGSASLHPPNRLDVEFPLEGGPPA